MRKFFSIPGILILFSFCHCKDNTPNTSNYIPSGPVSLVVNTDLPEYYKLKTIGTWVYLPGGNRGVILMHNFDDNFIALERTCSYEPDRACARIYVDSTSSTLRCGGYVSGKWDTCCLSRFLFDGQVSQQPAQYNLRTYNVSIDGSTISVRN